MSIFVAGLSYKTAAVEVREQLAVTPAKLSSYGSRLKLCGDLEEVVLVSTCNRVEIYGTTPLLTGRIDSLFRLLTSSAQDFRPQVYVHQDLEALSHLFSVTSGLDSMVLGETEITGQIKQAYEAAQTAGLTGRVLNQVFQKALQAAKEVRTRTQIGRGATSVGSVAVELAEKIFGKTLAEQTVIIIGAGKMGEACVRHLAKRGVKSVLVSNRSFDRAEALATEFGGRAVRFDDRLEAMVDADIVVGSTGCPSLVLHRAEVEGLMRQRRNRPLFMIDIAVPRDIDPGVQTLDNVFLYNIDDLEAVVRENVQHREQDLAQCQAIIEQRATALMARLSAVRERVPGAEVAPPTGWLSYGAAAVRG